jgi:hypothetical protein
MKSHGVPDTWDSETRRVGKLWSTKAGSLHPKAPRHSLPHGLLASQEGLAKQGPLTRIIGGRGHLYLSAGVQDWRLGARWRNPSGGPNREALTRWQLNGLWQDQWLLPGAIPGQWHGQLLGNRTVRKKAKVWI